MEKEQGAWSGWTQEKGTSGVQVQQEPGVPAQQASTVGSTIPASTTIDAIFTSLWATRSADLAATPIYTWAAASPPQLNATWAAATSPAVMMVAKFEIRNVPPSSVAP